MLLTHSAISPNGSDALEGGRDQIDVVDFQGMGYPAGNPRNLSDNPYNDWDPVWFEAAAATHTTVPTATLVYRQSRSQVNSA